MKSSRNHRKKWILWTMFTIFVRCWVSDSPSAFHKRATLPFYIKKGDVTRVDSQRRFSAQHSVTTLLLHCFESPQYFTNIWTGAIPHLLERLLLISWENNRDCHITMPLSLKIMEVQIKEEIRGSEWRGSKVWTLCCARNRHCESSRVILPYVPLPV